MTMTDNERNALRLLGIYTANRFDISLLAGPAKASCRAHIMGTLKGIKTPQSKSGVNELRREFWRIANVPNDCIAAKDEAFYAFAQANHKQGPRY